MKPLRLHPPISFSAPLGVLVLAAVACSDSTEPTDAGAVDATLETGVSNLCDDEGATRVAECGMCGTQSQACTSGEWTAQSECLGEGSCQVGDVETEDTVRCGQRQRICMDGCVWGPWDDIVEQGVCSPGEVFNDPDGCGPGISANTVCSDSCEYELADPSQCSTECGPRVPGTELEERLCIPPGDTVVFMTMENILWEEADLTAHPVSVSRFEIGRFPVTLERFQQCVEAGDCTGTAHADEPGWAAIASPTDAQEYCESLGGQLPTLAQLWRASRGDCEHPATFPWNACEPGLEREGGNCEHEVRCSEDCATRANSRCSPVGSTVGTAGAFGIEEVSRLNGSESVRDAFIEAGPDYRGLDPVLVAERPLLPGSQVFWGLVARFPAVSGQFRCVWEVE
ncbi:MAG: SUMF1/EgtB/PvdO family nonheme iron enzyme [Myxococcota bacterium]